MRFIRPGRIRHISIKLGSIVGAAAILGSGTAACSSTAGPSASGKVTISWWSWTSNPKDVIANFEKAYPNIKVTVPPNYGSGGTFYSKLTTALAGGTAPCVTQVEYDHLPQFLSQHDMTAITQYVSQYKKDFPAWVWNQVSQNGKVYAMPEDIGPMALMYQPSVLTKYNLPVPATWAQFASDAVALHKADPSQYLTYFAPNDADQMEALWWQAGAFPYQVQSDGSWKVNVDGPIEQKVMQFWGNLVTEGAAAVDQDFQADWGHHIGQDEYAAMVGAGWSPTYMVDAYLPALVAAVGHHADAAMDGGRPRGSQLGRFDQRRDEGLPGQPGEGRGDVRYLHQHLVEQLGGRREARDDSRWWPRPVPRGGCAGQRSRVLCPGPALLGQHQRPVLAVRR